MASLTHFRTSSDSFQVAKSAAWSVDGGQVELNGAALAAVGVQVPVQWPENAILLDVTAID